MCTNQKLQELQEFRSYRIGQRGCLPKGSKKAWLEPDRSGYWESELGTAKSPLRSARAKSSTQPASQSDSVTSQQQRGSPSASCFSNLHAPCPLGAPELLQLLPLIPRWSPRGRRYSLGRRRRGVHPQFEMAGRSRAGTFLPPEGSEFRADIRQ
jgi:hypothetical protein